MICVYVVTRAHIQDLKEIKMGLEGALNITDKMENSMNSMIIQKVLIAVRLPLTHILPSTQHIEGQCVRM